MKNYLLCFLILVGFSCNKFDEPEDAILDKEVNETDSVSTRIVVPPKTYKKLPNPYAIDVMRDVHKTAGLNSNLQPNHLYVKFITTNVDQLYGLKRGYGLELFDRPLDIQLADGERYIPPYTSSGVSWWYTTVPATFRFPEGIEYQILEECFIPIEPVAKTSSGVSINIELEAFKRVGYPSMPNVSYSSPVTPEGRMTVFRAGKEEPMKGVKVRCNTIVKWAAGYTNDEGYYSVDDHFWLNPIYDLIFENVKGFDIWGNYGFLGQATHHMSIRSRDGYSKCFYDNSGAWPWAVINNACYDYYNMCAKYGITRPPEELKIWAFESASSSSAPMLLRVTDLVTFTDSEKFLLNMLLVPAQLLFMDMIRWALPDITIGTSNLDYPTLYSTTFHELAHASHQTQAGSKYWANYMSYVITNDGYGQGTGTYAEICGIGEMWGYFMDHLCHSENFEPTLLQSNYSGSAPTWIKPHILWDLHRGNVLTRDEIFACLTPEITTYKALLEKLYFEHPTKASQIEAAFHQYNIKPDVPKPFENNRYLGGRLPPYAQTFTGANIYIEDAESSCDGMISMKASYSINIEQNFVCYLLDKTGSGFEMILQ